VVWHGGGLGHVAGVEDVVGLLESFIGASPDLYAAEQDIVAENGLVVVRLVVSATVKGTMLGVPAHGKPVRWSAVDIYRVTAARSARSGLPTTSRRSWSRSALSPRPWAA
jgi:predicted ester cyclase